VTDQELKAELDRRFSAVTELIQQVAGGLERRIDGLEKRMDQRFDELDQRLERVENRLTAIDFQLAGMNRSFDRRERTVSELVAAQEAQQKIIADLAGRV